eukprot:4780574-Pleurochrysis_carterae.AAC.2
MDELAARFSQRYGSLRGARILAYMIRLWPWPRRSCACCSLQALIGARSISSPRRRARVLSHSCLPSRQKGIFVSCAVPTGGLAEFLRRHAADFRKFDAFASLLPETHKSTSLYLLFYAVYHLRHRARCHSARVSTAGRFCCSARSLRLSIDLPAAS